jgi:hypothetical protein
MSFWEKLYPEVSANVHGVWIPLYSRDQDAEDFNFLLKPDGSSELLVNAPWTGMGDRNEVAAEVVRQRVDIDDYYMELCTKKTFRGMVSFAGRVKHQWEKYRQDNPLQNPFFAK